MLEGWDVEHSYFSYRQNTYNSNFGFPGRELESGARPSASDPEYAELYFNIGLRREFLDPFIGNLIPIAVVALLLFGVLYTIRTVSTRQDRFGFNTSAVLGFCAALFFVVILGHTSLRESLAAQGIIYLEYFYFALYLTILGVSASAILVGREGHRWLNYGDNLIPRLAYWPLFTGALFVVTLASFG